MAEANRKVRFVLINLVRILLVAAFVMAYIENRRLLLVATAAFFIATLLPDLMGMIFKKYSNALFEVILLLFIFSMLSYWEIRGVYSNFIVLAEMMNVAEAIAIGFIGLTLIYSLFKNTKLEESVFVLSIFSFCFAFSIGVIIELGKILSDEMFGFNFHQASVFGMAGDLGVYLVACLFVSAIGYYSLKRKKNIFISRALESFIGNNLKVLGFNQEAEENHPDRIKELIKKGEANNLEFKSTLRKNLNTKTFDRQIEHSVLKTVNAYLNSDGGTLLIGVSDKGEIMGMENDEFKSKEHINRHINNLITNHIGAEFMPMIKADVVDVDGKMLVKVECKKSDRESFLAHGDEEEFYIRRGSLSMPLSGSALLKYIETKFRKED